MDKVCSGVGYLHKIPTVCAYHMNIYCHSAYRPAAELEFCLRIYYSSQTENWHGLIVQYQVDCVIIPDQTETIAVRIVCILQSVNFM